jgi:hypothetical protein
MKSEAIVFIGVLLLASIAFLIAYQAPGDIFLSFGPNDFPYVSGFREDFEIDEPTFIHWSQKRGHVALPFVLDEAPLDIAFRYKRHVALPAEVRVFVGSTQVERFEAPQQDFTVRTIRLEHNPLPHEPVEISFLAQSPDPRPLGLALDWLQIRPQGRVIPTLEPFLYLLGVVAGLTIFVRLIGFSRRFTVFLALGAVSALVVWVVSHKLAPIHAASLLGWRFHVASILVITFFYVRRRDPNSVFSRPEARWAMLAFYLGTLVRLMGLFHSEFYYPDVRTHSKFVSLIWTEGLGGFFTDHIAHQHRHLLGLQLVGDKWLAFPYPPLLYLSIYPLSLLRLPVDDWMKFVPTLLAGIEGLVVFALAFRLGASSRAAATATWFHATAAVLAFRLTVASYASMFGHFWDTLVVLYLVIFFERMNRLAFGAGLATLIAISLLSYAGSALVLGLFIPAFVLVLLMRSQAQEDRGRAARVALWALIGALFAVSVFYIQYLPELTPGLLDPNESITTPESLIAFEFTPLAALKMAAHRINIFYGPFFGLLAFVGIPLIRKYLPDRLTLPLVAATLVTFFGLNFLRSGLGQTHIFQFTKDDLVLLPLATIVYGCLFDRLYKVGRAGRMVAVLLVAGWVTWGCIALARDVKIRFRRPDYPPIAVELSPVPLRAVVGLTDSDGDIPLSA